MAVSLNPMSINRIIVHTVHLRADDGSVVTPTYSAALTTLPPKGMEALKNRLVLALGKDSHGLEMSIVRDGAGSCLRAASSLLDADEGEFVEVSKQMADKLADAQTSRKWPGGALVVLTGTTVGKRFICLIKAETHEGFHNKTKPGAIIMEHITELLLTPQQKLYKIGLYVENKKVKTCSAKNYSAYVFDHNMSQKETANAARYFYNAFLGCEVPQSAKRTTRDYYHKTRDFINSADLDSETKVDLYNSLYTYLKMDNAATISVDDFAQKYLGNELRDAYCQYMAENEIPMDSFAKDLEYVKGSLRRRRVKFTSDVLIIAPAEQFNDLVTVVDSNSQSTTVRIKGKVSAQG